MKLILTALLALGTAALAETRPMPRPAVAFAAPAHSAHPHARVIPAMAQRAPDMTGAVCGDPAIKGSVIGPVKGRVPACNIENAVRVRAVSGVALTNPATFDCATARALKTWVDQGAKPALKPLGELVTLRVPPNYSCRTRNHQPGAKLSEHGKGKAIDVTALTLRGGRTITLLGDWGRGSEGRALRQMHKAACGPFGTVLGPESDRFHRDHFHFDTANHRGGPYCR